MTSRTVTKSEMLTLANLIEAGEGLITLRLRNGTTYPYQLGVKRTAMVIAALRSQVVIAQSPEDHSE